MMLWGKHGDANDTFDRVMGGVIAFVLWAVILLVVVLKK